MKTVVIIGAGFCGTVTAARLLRQSPVPLEVVLINRSGPMARGLAYGTRTEQHVLNVPAGRMGAFVEDEAGFLRYAQQRDPSISGSSFVPRRLFGDYLESLLDEAEHNAAGSRLRKVTGDVARIETDTSLGLRVILPNETIPADRVVMALGNFAPAQPRLAAGDKSFYRSPRYAHDPWAPDALGRVHADRRVLLIGSGLTMLDVVLKLRHAGHTQPIHAISRRGLMPLPHRHLDTPPHYQNPLPQRLPQTPTAREYLHAVREEVRRSAAEGVDWRDIIGGLRATTPALWQTLPTVERARFLRHLRPYWEVHRHRCAPAAEEQLLAEQQAGTFELIGGRLLDLSDAGSSVKVTLRRRRGGIEHLSVGSVINCTGPEADTRSLAEPLIVNLRERGLVVPDELGLGLQTSPDHALIDREGRASTQLYYVGPFLRAQHWEATAVPELRQHVAQLSQTLSASLAAE